MHEESLPLLSKYYEVLDGTSYYKRDSERIQTVLLELGLEVKETSQDYVKGRIARHLGFTGISTYSQLGKYIGRTGEHKSLLSSFFQHKRLFNIHLDKTWSVSSTDIREFLDNSE
jgi:hypothetical protein